MGKILLHENVETMVEVMPRIEALYYFVYELAECFHADESTLSSIKTGILDNQILETVTLLYKNTSNENIGKVVINIDWDKHFLLVNTDEGEVLEFDMSKSIVDNVVNWRRVVVIHIEEIMKQYNVINVESVYNFRNQLYESDDILQKTQHIMNMHTIEEKIDDRIVPEFQSGLDAAFGHEEIKNNMKKRSFDCGLFKEVSVDMYYKVK